MYLVLRNVVPLLRTYDIRFVVTTYNQLYININNDADFKFSAHDPILEKPSSGDTQNQNILKSWEQ